MFIGCATGFLSSWETLRNWVLSCLESRLTWWWSSWSLLTIDIWWRRWWCLDPWHPWYSSFTKNCCTWLEMESKSKETLSFLSHSSPSLTFSVHSFVNGRQEDKFLLNLLCYNLFFTLSPFLLSLSLFRSEFFFASSSLISLSSPPFFLTLLFLPHLLSNLTLPSRLSFSITLLEYLRQSFDSN